MLPVRSPIWLQVVSVGIAFTALAVLATWPIASDPAHVSVVEPTENDYRLNNYLIFWGAHALLTDPLAVHHTNMFHPERYTFVYADILLAHSLLMLPIIQVFYNPVLTFNVLLILSLGIGATGAFMLARAITGRADAAFLGAALWAFNPVHMTRYQQIQLVGDHWLPWLAWALWIWLRPIDGGAVSKARWPLVAATFFCLNALSGSHIAVFGGLLAAMIVGFFAAQERRWRDRRFATGVATFGLACIVVLAPLFWPYLLVEDQLAASRAETLDLPNASLRPLELFSARSRFYLWLDETVGWPSVLNRDHRELRAYAFPGVVALVLAAVGVAAPAAAGPRREKRFWLAVTAAFLFLAMGSYGGYWLLGDLPLFRLIRVPTRFMLPAVLALAMLAAYGAAAIARRIDGPDRRVAVLAAIALLFAGEASFAPLRTWEYDQEPRRLSQFLAQQPGDFAVLEVPIDPFGYAINMRQVFQSVFHWKRLLVGYSGFQSQANIDLLRRVRDGFPSDACLDELADLGVRFVVVLTDRVDEGVLAAVAAQPRLEPAWRHEGWSVYQVRPTPQP